MEGGVRGEFELAEADCRRGILDGEDRARRCRVFGVLVVDGPHLEDHVGVALASWNGKQHQRVVAYGGGPPHFRICRRIVEGVKAQLERGHEAVCVGAGPGDEDRAGEAVAAGEVIHQRTVAHAQVRLGRLVLQRRAGDVGVAAGGKGKQTGP